MRQPIKTHRVSRDTKTEKNCRVPQFFVLSLPYRGTDGAARAMQARLDIAESRQKSTKSSLEGWMLLCFFLRAEESKRNRRYSFERDKQVRTPAVKQHYIKNRFISEGGSVYQLY